MQCCLPVTVDKLDSASLKDITLQHEWMIMVTIRRGTRTIARTGNKYQEGERGEEEHTKEEEEQKEQEEEEQKQEERRFRLSMFCLSELHSQKITTARRVFWCCCKTWHVIAQFWIVFYRFTQFPRAPSLTCFLHGLARQDIGATPHAGDLDESGQRFMKAGWHAPIERMILLVVVDDAPLLYFLNCICI